MKKHLLLALLFSFVAGTSHAQFSILFVNDNDAFPYETDTVLSALSKTTYTVDYWNAVDSLDGPTAAVMGNYDLVMWYAGVDGSSLHFWNQLDEDDPEILTFLSNEGSLWIMGTDILYDRYGVPTTTFATGEMVYDYCGLLSYDKQSYADDGSTGAPAVGLSTPLAVIGPDTLTWIYPTTWYIDGVTLTSEASSFYEMGPASYTLSGQVTGAFRQGTTSAERVMTYLFNPAEISQSGIMIVNFFQQHLDWWSGLPTTTSNPVKTTSLTAWPVPSAGLVQLSRTGSFLLNDALGRQVKTINGNTLDLSDQPSGMYYLTENGSGEVLKLVKE